VGPSLMPNGPGLRVDDADNSLTIGERGPSVLCEAAFLRPGVRTPVFVRFSTVAGSGGSADTARDVRGFATKFYTEEGNFDLVGNNMPVFFIQDGIKFPDLIHAVKPEPDREIPQAQSAHDTFWDFVSLQPESTHMLMWVMSDRAIPRSFATMEGFGVHTFRLVAEDGSTSLVKWHWKPVAGIHSLVWEESQKLGGIDLLDSTKLIPEELCPVRVIGRMTLDRNPTNYFAETEQVAFHPGHLVPGIDIVDDPLLHARLVSYLDTQLTRLGGPNFGRLPINRPVAPVNDNNRDGHAQQAVHEGAVAYTPNSLGGGCPFAHPGAGTYAHVPREVAGATVKLRPSSFDDHFSQATKFYRSLTAVEQEHMAGAFSFELGKCVSQGVHARVVANLAQVNADLAGAVAAHLGIEAPAAIVGEVGLTSPALSMERGPDGSLAGRQVAMLVTDAVVPAGDPDEAMAVFVQEAYRHHKTVALTDSVFAARLGTSRGDDQSLVRGCSAGDPERDSEPQTDRQGPSVASVSASGSNTLPVVASTSSRRTARTPRSGPTNALNTRGRSRKPAMITGFAMPLWTSSRGRSTQPRMACATRSGE